MEEVGEAFAHLVRRAGSGLVADVPAHGPAPALDQEEITLSPLAPVTRSLAHLKDPIPKRLNLLWFTT